MDPVSPACWRRRAVSCRVSALSVVYPARASEAGMASNVVKVGDVEIMMLSDGMLEFDPCNFFPTIPEDNWKAYESHLHEHKVRFNLGSYLIRAGGRTVLIDTGLGPRPAETPDAPWGQLMNDFKDKGVAPEAIDMVVMTHLHRDHIGWNLKAEAGKYAPTFPARATGCRRRTGSRATTPHCSRR